MRESAPVVDAPQEVAFPTRRELLTAAAGAAAALGIPTAASAARPTPAPIDPSQPPVTEGFFFVIPAPPGKSNSVETSRIFFLKSSWLPYFELTDLISVDLTKKKKVYDLLQGSHVKWGVMYSDNIPAAALQKIDNSEAFAQPAVTYLAMSIAPDNL